MAGVMVLILKYEAGKRTCLERDEVAGRARAL